MSKNYLPTADAALGNFSTGLYTNLASDPQGFGTTAERVAELDTTRLRYLEALALINNRATRTAVTLEQKIIAKRRLNNSIRSLVKVLQASAVMTDDKRRQLGITVPDQRTPVGPPRGIPGLDVVEVDGRRVTVQLHNADGRRRKPAEVSGANLYSFVGELPPEDPSQWKSEGATSRTRVQVDFAVTVPAGAMVWLAACWVNAKFQSGNACAPISTRTNHGGLAKAA